MSALCALPVGLNGALASKMLLSGMKTQVIVKLAESGLCLNEQFGEQCGAAIEE